MPTRAASPPEERDEIRRELKAGVARVKDLLTSVADENDELREVSVDTPRSEHTLWRERDKLRQLNERLAQTTATSAELLAELDAKNETLTNQRQEMDRLNKRLARASATSAELVAELEVKNDALAVANRDLARANAHAAELMAEIELKNVRIEMLNGALARANASAAELLSELDKSRDDLQEALDHVKTLQGIIPICMYCHDICDDEASWQRLEQYIQANSDAKFSHGLCPRCSERYFPDDLSEDERRATETELAETDAGSIRRARRHDHI